ncbi:uncharacterized protein LOC120449182 isoform X2 [Drosophila santomea]|uniref:uncharacterized protein LOC120449182 isoform X2 n=1 Tax=Drosophila santomea TaxID=129105 RepID=UPI0019544344|nr:uncharacterized protein LOC120449182 isoform X2 [Drosophila santomea]
MSLRCFELWLWSTTPEQTQRGMKNNERERDSNRAAIKFSYEICRKKQLWAIFVCKLVGEKAVQVASCPIPIPKVACKRSFSHLSAGYQRGKNVENNKLSHKR